MSPCRLFYCQINSDAHRPTRRWQRRVGLCLNRERTPVPTSGCPRSFTSGRAAALVAHFLKLSVDHIFIGFRLRAGTGRTAGTRGRFAARVRARGRAGARLAARIGALRDAGRRLSENLGLLLDDFLVVGSQRLLQVVQCRLRLGTLIGTHLVPQILERLVHRVDHRIGAVTRLDQLTEQPILGRMRGAGGISVRSTLPSDLLSAPRSRSPCSTWMVTAVWLSSAVENTFAALVGMVVFFSISLVITPPSVSIPSDSGVTSSSSTSLTSPASTPPWIAAPTATGSPGVTSLRGSMPKKSRTYFCTSGIRVCPPTRMTSATSLASSPASLSAPRQGPMVRFTRSSTSDSSLARVSLTFRCFGPLASAVMYGRLTSVCWLEDNSILAFSAASFRRW